ncbi:hypothetical protein ACWA5Z_10165 [Testudinibacter sp. P80/BLE/0925]|uniref:hypothetical protein n=1 Tax=Testudinibacter sp. TW-1 TaxID=3417757 RepID=UPI003D365EA7
MKVDIKVDTQSVRKSRKILFTMLFCSKLLLILLAVMLLAWLAMNYLPQVAGINEWLKSTWYFWLGLRLILYSTIAWIIYEIHRHQKNINVMPIIRWAIALIVVAELANILQLTA